MSASREEEVDRLSQALLREFMHRNKCKGSLEAFDLDKPRDDNTISSRSLMASKLHLESLIRANKSRPVPYASMLEVMVSYFLDAQHQEGNDAKTKVSSKDKTTGRRKPREGFGEVSNERDRDEPSRNRSSSPRDSQQTDRQSSRSTHATAAFSQPEDEPTPFHRPRPSHVSDPVPSASFGSHIERTQPSQAGQRSRNAFQSSVTNDMEMMMVEDVEDFDFDPTPAPRTQSSSRVGGAGGSQSSHQRSSRGNVGGTELSSSTIGALHQLLFGKAQKTFDATYNQGFFFTDERQLPFGLMQVKGGPCGVIAPVQAFLLIALMDLYHGAPDFSQLQSVSSAQRTSALVSALSNILWQATSRGDEQQGSLVVPDRSGSRFQVIPFSSLNDVQQKIRDHFSDFSDPNGNGLQLFIYSVLLSHGMNAVKSEMDDKDAPLIGRHNYCTQELVNLFMFGEAVSNTHDSSSAVDGLNLRGVGHDSMVGFLSIFEAHGYLKVGSRLKNPKYPIWILHIESHFSVLFGLTPMVISSESTAFDLYYYDELGRQDEVVKLSISKGDRTILSQDDDLIPPINLCIRTKWTRADVDWNHTDPYL